MQQLLGFLSKAFSFGMHKVGISSALLRLVGTITSVETGEPLVALTFDDGPHPTFTPRLLEVLTKHQARATFFMIGKYAQRYPQLVGQVAEGGHTIGNHSWNHRLFPTISGRERRQQIRACARVLAPHAQRFFRPPGGHQTLRSRLDALWLYHDVVTWNVIIGDWVDHDYNANRIFEKLKNKIGAGSIVLLHDALWDAKEERVTDRGPVIQAVDMLLEYFAGRFRFVTLPELLRHGHPVRRFVWWSPKA